MKGPPVLRHVFVIVWVLLLFPPKVTRDADVEIPHRLVTVMARPQLLATMVNRLRNRPLPWPGQTINENYSLFVSCPAPPTYPTT